MSHTILQFFEACRPFGYPLLACSVILVSAICYHLFFTGDKRLIGKLLRLADGADAAANLAQECRKHPHNPLAAILLHALEHADDPATAKTVEARLQQYLDGERAGMATISVITNIAPMLGILGTAWGLVDIFGVFGSPAAGEGVALGISKALYTTIFGLAIAVPGIIALTCFERGLERRAAILNTLFTELLTKTRNK